MALPEIDIAQVQRWCAARVPEHARHQVRVECEVTPRHLTIVERRVPWREDLGPDWTSLPEARLHYTAVDQSWTSTGATATYASISTTSAAALCNVGPHTHVRRPLPRAASSRGRW